MLNAKWQLGKAMEALEFALEKRRVEEVKTRKEEINFGVNLEDCPICLEPMAKGYHYSNQNIPMLCCAKMMCHACSEKCREEKVTLCVMCREPRPHISERDKIEALKQKHANKPYFQYMLAMEYFGNDTQGGLRPRKEEQ